MKLPQNDQFELQKAASLKMQSAIMASLEDSLAKINPARENK